MEIYSWDSLIYGVQPGYSSVDRPGARLEKASQRTLA